MIINLFWGATTGLVIGFAVGKVSSWPARIALAVIIGIVFGAIRILVAETTGFGLYE